MQLNTLVINYKFNYSRTSPSRISMDRSNDSSYEGLRLTKVVEQVVGNFDYECLEL